MKKFLSIFMVLALLLGTVGCGKQMPEYMDATDAKYHDKETEGEENESVLEEETTVAVQFDGNSPLFAAQDNIDDDRDYDSVYYYNYKGDFLYSVYEENIGLYSSNGMAPAKDPSTGKYGFVDQSGVFVIEPQWDATRSFSDDGVALVVIKNEEYYDGYQHSTYKYGFINEKGEQIVPCIYNFATSFFSNGLAIVAKEIEKDEDIYMEFGVIDMDGNVIVPLKYERFHYITGNYILCRTSENTEGGGTARAFIDIYDLNGKLVWQEQYYEKDGSQRYRYEVSGETLIRYTDEREWLGEYWSDFQVIEEAVFDGKAFQPIEIKNDVRVESRRVATSSSGTAYGLVRGEETVIPFNYDKIEEYNGYYVAIQYVGSQTLCDIYNNLFEKTAEDIPYWIETDRNYPAGPDILLPAGYFWARGRIEGSYDRHGVVDYTGKVIVPVKYGDVYLYTYEGFGGNFD